MVKRDIGREREAERDILDREITLWKEICILKGRHTEKDICKAITMYDSI